MKKPFNTQFLELHIPSQIMKHIDFCIFIKDIDFEETKAHIISR